MTHLEERLQVELVGNALAQDVLVLTDKGDVGVSQVQARFLWQRKHKDETT